MVNIWIQSPSRMVAAGLATLVTRLGYAVQVDAETPADLGLWDLSHAQLQLAPPPVVPTLALVSGDEAEDDLVALIALGYKGYLKADAGVETLERALGAIGRGETWAERAVISQVLSQRSDDTPITDREAAVFHLASHGLSNQQIAEELGIATKTVKAHMSSIFKKVGVSRRAGLVAVRLPRPSATL